MIDREFSEAFKKFNDSLAVSSVGIGKITPEEAFKSCWPERAAELAAADFLACQSWQQGNKQYFTAFAFRFADTVNMNSISPEEALTEEEITSWKRTQKTTVLKAIKAKAKDWGIIGEPLFFVIDTTNETTEEAASAFFAGMKNAARVIVATLNKTKQSTKNDRATTGAAFLVTLGNVLNLNDSRMRIKEGHSEAIADGINRALNETIQRLPKKIETQRNTFAVPMKTAEAGRVRTKRNDWAEKWLHDSAERDQKKKGLILETFSPMETVVYCAILRVNTAVHSINEYAEAAKNNHKEPTPPELTRTGAGWIYRPQGGNWIFTTTKKGETATFNELVFSRDWLLHELGWSADGKQRYKGERHKNGKILDLVLLDLSRGVYHGITKEAKNNKFKKYAMNESLFSCELYDIVNGEEHTATTSDDGSIERAGRRSPAMVRLTNLNPLLLLDEHASFDLISFKALAGVFNRLTGKHEERTKTAIDATRTIMLSGVDSGHFKTAIRPLETLGNLHPEDDKIIEEELAENWGIAEIDRERGTWTAEAKTPLLFKSEKKRAPKPPK